MSISTFLRTLLSPRRMRASLDAHQPRPYLTDLEKFATLSLSEEFVCRFGRNLVHSWLEAPELKVQQDSLSGLMRGSGLLRGAMGSMGPTSVVRPLSKVRWSVNCGTFVELASTVGPQLKGAIPPLNRCVFCVRVIFANLCHLSRPPLSCFL